MLDVLEREVCSSLLAPIEFETDDYSAHLQTANFTLVDRTVALAVVLHGTHGLELRSWIDDRPVMYKMVNNVRLSTLSLFSMLTRCIQLLKYLRSERAVYHLRAVNLIWALEGATERPHVESIIARSLTSPERGNVQEAFEAFGVLWRLTGSLLRRSRMDEFGLSDLQRITCFQDSDSGSLS